MAAPSMAETNADSLERSFGSFSIHDAGRRCDGGVSGGRENRKSDTAGETDLITVDLDSEIPLPYDWERCLDLKTGEIYFVNRSNGMRTNEDPRGMAEYGCEYYYSDDGEDDEEESSEYETDDDDTDGEDEGRSGTVEEENVLVVAGCRGCFIYYMVPKQVKDCVKCNRQLLHFDRPENSSQAV